MQTLGGIKRGHRVAETLLDKSKTRKEAPDPSNVSCEKVCLGHLVEQVRIQSTELNISAILFFESLAVHDAVYVCLPDKGVIPVPVVSLDEGHAPSARQEDFIA